MAEDSDVQCLLQIESLQLDYQMPTKEKMSFINAALLDENVSHKDVFFLILL